MSMSPILLMAAEALAAAAAAAVVLMDIIVVEEEAALPVDMAMLLWLVVEAMSMSSCGAMYGKSTTGCCQLNFQVRR